MYITYGMAHKQRRASQTILNSTFDKTYLTSLSLINLMPLTQNSHSKVLNSLLYSRKTCTYTDQRKCLYYPFVSTVFWKSAHLYPFSRESKVPRRLFEELPTTVSVRHFFLSSFLDYLLNCSWWDENEDRAYTALAEVKRRRRHIVKYGSC